MLNKYKPIVKSTIRSFASIPFSQKILSRWKGNCAILNLHRVMPDSYVKNDDNPQKNLVLSQSRLAELLEYLTAKYQILPLDDLIPHLQSDSQELAVFVTLDDGYKDNLEYALPVFEQYQLHVG